jgi:hypothetical protein
MQSAALDPHVQRRLQNPYNNPLPAIPNFYAVSLHDSRDLARIAAAEGARVDGTYLACILRSPLPAEWKSDELRQVRNKYIFAAAGSPLSGCFGEARHRRMRL